MSAYKNKKTGKWDVSFRIVDWKGETKQIHKRGFITKREALSFENSYQNENKGSTDMTVEEFVGLYLHDIQPRIKESTYDTKVNQIYTKIIPYFGKKKLVDISSSDVMKWQNELISKVNRNNIKYKSSYLKTIHNQLSAMLNFAVRYYGLQKNVAAVVGNMGNEKEIKMKFWTLEQYRIFIQELTDDPVLYYTFEILYWCGLREGEMLALTFGDINFSDNTISVTKTYHKAHGKDIITMPKTPKSNRIISMPDELAEELKDFFSMIVDTNKDARIFESVSKYTLYRTMRSICKKTGLPRIRVHDLRHSHVSLLINNGFSALAIADRMGHESETITYRYAHLFPSTKTRIVNALNNLKGGI